MKKIPLTQGRFALVDDEDFERLSAYKWCVTVDGYAHTWAKGKLPKMHRLILGLVDRKIDCDHINGNKLDNRRVNLRVASRSQNNANVGLRKDNASGYKGVHWHKSRSKWQAQIAINSNRVYLGIFSSVHDAARAYNKAALEHFGPFAKLNEVPK